MIIYCNDEYKKANGIFIISLRQNLQKHINRKRRYLKEILR